MYNSQYFPSDAGHGGWSMDDYTAVFPSLMYPSLAPEAPSLPYESPYTEVSQVQEPPLSLAVKHFPSKRQYQELRPRPLEAVNSKSIDPALTHDQENKGCLGTQEQSTKPRPRRQPVKEKVTKTKATTKKATTKNATTKKATTKKATTKKATTKKATRAKATRTEITSGPCGPGLRGKLKTTLDCADGPSSVLCPSLQEADSISRFPESVAVACTQDDRDRMDASQDRPITAAYNPEGQPDLKESSLLSPKRRLVQALRALLRILEGLDDFILDASAINGWVTEIEKLDGKTIPTEQIPPCQVVESLERLISILISCFTGPDSTRLLVFREQLPQLLDYIQDPANFLAFPSDHRMLVWIGKWMERLDEPRAVTEIR